MAKVRFGVQLGVAPFNFPTGATITLEGVGTFNADATSNGGGSVHQIPEGTYKISFNLPGYVLAVPAQKDAWITNPNYMNYPNAPVGFSSTTTNPTEVTFRPNEEVAGAGVVSEFDGNLWVYIKPRWEGFASFNFSGVDAYHPASFKFSRNTSRIACRFKITSSGGDTAVRWLGLFLDPVTPPTWKNDAFVPGANYMLDISAPAVISTPIWSLPFAFNVSPGDHELDLLITAFHGMTWAGVFEIEDLDAVSQEPSTSQPTSTSTGTSSSETTSATQLSENESIIAALAVIVVIGIALYAATR
jgi:hypothetical protein